jgi:hypothetical protein
MIAGGDILQPASGKVEVAKIARTFASWSISPMKFLVQTRFSVRAS